MKNIEYEWIYTYVDMQNIVKIKNIIEFSNVCLEFNDDFELLGIDDILLTNMFFNVSNRILSIWISKLCVIIHSVTDNVILKKNYINPNN